MSFAFAYFLKFYHSHYDLPLRLFNISNFSVVPLKMGIFRNKMKINQITKILRQHRHSLFKPKLWEDWMRWCANWPAALN